MEGALKQAIALSIPAIIVSALSSGTPAYAADLLDVPETVEPVMVAPNPFHGSLSLYGWYAGWLSGDVGVGGLGPVEIGSGGGEPVDILEILDGFFMAKGDIRYGRFGLYGDFIWTGFGDTVDGPLGFVSADWDFDLTVLTAAVSYQFIDVPGSQVHVMAGARYWGVDVGLGLNLPAGGGPEANRNLDLFDPVVGLRGEHFLTRKFFVEGTGLIGGALGDSEFMWDGYAGVGYNFTDNFSGSVGYRGIGLDYEDGGTVLDIIIHGPMATLTAKF
jgi:opacity protein-like surface antigen